jgi:SRSO17 transposase
MVEGDVSHDKVTRFLSDSEFTSRDLWREVKPIIRKIEKDDGVLIFDDTVQEKAWTDENEVICWHYDHCLGRSVKGINLLNAVYHCSEISIPVAFEVIRKPLMFSDLKTRKVKRSSEQTKNEMLRDMIQSCINNALKFGYVLMDCWFAAQENFEFIRNKNKHFIAALKNNRLVALNDEDRSQGKFIRVEALHLLDQQAVQGYLKGFKDKVLIVRRVFTNKDGSTGILNLVCSDLTVNGTEVAALYKKRWNVEVFHKSLKSNAGLAKSPTRRPTTQINHVFLSICAVFKLECLKMHHKVNHFALRTKLYVNSLRHAYQKLTEMASA